MPTPAPYTDIYIRDNYGDMGTIPSTGNPYASPDIIPLQSGTLGWPKAADSYPNPPDLGLVIVNPGVNNIYIRAKNNGTAASSATAQLYWAEATLFLVPRLWTAVGPAAGPTVATMLDQNQSATIAGGAICLSNPAFSLTGLPAPPPGGHYCLVGVIQTPTHAVPLPQSFASNAAMVQWIQNNPGVGWRNINIIPNGQTQTVLSYGFGSTDPAPGDFHFRIRCVGYAAGTPLQVQCTDARCPFSFSLTVPVKDSHGNQITGFDVNGVPGLDSLGNYFTSSYTMTLTSTGGAFPPGAELHVNYYEYPAAGDALHMEVGRFAEVAREQNGKRMQYNAFLIPIGECTTIVAAASAEDAQEEA
jgi:hypothetical protein